MKYYLSGVGRMRCALCAVLVSLSFLPAGVRASGWGDFRGNSFELSDAPADSGADGAGSGVLAPLATATPADLYDFNVVRMFLLTDRFDPFTEVTDPQAGQLLYPAIIFSIDGPITSANVPFRLAIDGVEYCAAVAPSLAANEMIYIWCGPQWVATGGAHVLSGSLDPANSVLETDETNNAATLEFFVSGDTPTPAPTATELPTYTETESPTPTPSATETATPSPTRTGHQTKSPTPTPSPSATQSPTPSPSPTPSATYTVSPSATPTPADCRIKADFDCNGCTDLQDFLTLLDYWFVDYQGKMMDLDDFLALLDNWQVGCV